MTVVHCPPFLFAYFSIIRFNTGILESIRKSGIGPWVRLDFLQVTFKGGIIIHAL